MPSCIHYYVRHYLQINVRWIGYRKLLIITMLVLTYVDTFLVLKGTVVVLVLSRMPPYIINFNWIVKVKS